MITGCNAGKLPSHTSTNAVNSGIYKSITTKASEKAHPLKGGLWGEGGAARVAVEAVADSDASLSALKVPAAAVKRPNGIASSSPAVLLMCIDAKWLLGIFPPWT